MNKSARGVVFTLILLVLGFALILPDKANIGVIGLDSLKTVTSCATVDTYQICSTADFFIFVMQFIGLMLILFDVFLMVNQTAG